MTRPKDTPAQTHTTPEQRRKPLEESVTSDEPTDLPDSSQAPNPESRGEGVDPKLARRIAKATFDGMQQALESLQEAGSTYYTRAEDPAQQHDGTPPNDENVL